MRTVSLKVTCNATYRSELDIPDEIPQEEELEYIREHLHECKILGDLEWLGDLSPESAVTKEDILSHRKQ